jgi:hypothetical protein
MNSYDSTRDPDEQPIGGGRFNEDDVGSECENFRRCGRRLLGFVRPPSARGGINIERLGGQRGASVVDGVLVILVAKHPTQGKQRIVGWYDRARCHAEQADRSSRERGVYGVYNFECAAADAQLLEPIQRTQEIPKGRSAMGQANVFYAEYPQNRGKAGAWIDAAVRFVLAGGTGVPRPSASPRRGALPLPLYEFVSERVATVAPKPFTKDPETLDRALGVHRRMQNALARIARRHGHEVVRPAAGWPEFDLGWIEHDTFTVVEVKSLDDVNEIQQLRYGVGQLLDYRQQLAARFRFVRSVLAVEREPGDPRWRTLCQRLGIDLVWPQTFSRVFGRDGSRRRPSRR